MERIKDPVFQRQIFEIVLGTLTTEPVGFKRVRLWWHPRHNSRLQDSNIALLCIASQNAESKLSPNISNKYLGIAGLLGEEYCDLTLSMKSSPPFARCHNADMFAGLPDANFDLLEKTKDGSWMVTPIITGLRLPGHEKRIHEVSGCISADFQYLDPATDQIVDDWPKEQTNLDFRKHALELAADILTPLLQVYRLDTAEIRQIRTVRGTIETSGHQECLPVNAIDP